MNISMDSLIPFEKLKANLDEVLNTVEQKGYAVILKNNEPAYIITSYRDSDSLTNLASAKKTTDHTLHEAMRIVLQEQEKKQMYAADLADEIFNRGLYTKKNGEKARYNQIRARANNYPDLFEPLPGNIIKLREA